MNFFKVLTLAFLTGSISWSATANANDGVASKVDYSKAYEVKVGQMGKYSARYIKTLQYNCLIVQTSQVGTSLKVYKQKEFCSLGSKSFDSDFADVSFDNLKFEGDKLLIDLGLSELRAGYQTFRQCSIQFSAGEISDMTCSAP